MYLKKKGSIEYRIKDQYTVYLPPIPKREQILFHDLKKSDQFWRRTPLPAYYEDRRAEELAEQKRESELVDEGVLARVKHFDPVLERYRRQEWMRRIYGIWFMNNGKPVYLTGSHYYYLQWSKLDQPDNNGYPIFYIPQIDRFYFRQLCMEDPFCLGYLMIGPRGYGKTAEEVSAQLENITKPGHMRHAAIQSKNAEDAQVVIFQEKMVPMFNAMPDFFKPEYSHGTNPKDQFIFRRPSIRSKMSKTIKHGESFELGNTVMCYPPQNKALDGKTISDMINDEIAKCKPEKDMDAHTRNQVNVRTVIRNQVKRGIIRGTTTVEEMEEGGNECYKIWDESNPLKRDGNGYTISKLYRLFIPATDTQADLADKYGNIPYDKAYIKIIAEREPLKDDNSRLAPIIRKNPLNEEEAFLKAQDQSIYDVMILSKRITELTLQKAEQKYRRFYAEWVNGEVDGQVELIENPNGPITLFYYPDVMWSKNRRLLNACSAYTDESGRKQWMPCNNDLFRASTDPIRFVKTDDPRASKMAAHGMMMYIPELDNGKDDNDPDVISKNIMWEYCARHTDPEIDYENIIKLIRYFGHSIMPEANAGDFYKHLFSRGYQRFIIVRKNFTADILTSKQTKNRLNGENPVSSNEEVIQSYVRRTAAFIRRHGHRINSIPLLRQLLAFDPKNPTKFDLAVSFGYGILSLEADLEYYETSQKAVEMVLEYFNRYDISGNQSKLVQSASTDGDDDSHDYSDPAYFREIMMRG